MKKTIAQIILCLAYGLGTLFVLSMATMFFYLTWPGSTIFAGGLIATIGLGLLIGWAEENA